jgi:hypothetical protein
MALDSFPMYVNFDHSVFFVPYSCFLPSEIDLKMEILYPLLCKICCIIIKLNLL